MTLIFTLSFTTTSFNLFLNTFNHSAHSVLQQALLVPPSKWLLSLLISHHLQCFCPYPNHQHFPKTMQCRIFLRILTVQFFTTYGPFSTSQPDWAFINVNKIHTSSLLRCCCVLSIQSKNQILPHLNGSAWPHSNWFPTLAPLTGLLLLLVSGLLTSFGHTRFLADLSIG